MISRSFARARHHYEVLLLALFSYAPTLLFSVGTYNADTKLYLTTNVGKLMSQARYAWDPSQFAGYVPHQAVGYLWPIGPFYWVFEIMHFPAWFAQRSWVATLFFLASLGAYQLCRHFRFSPPASLIAALAYQFTPYVLAYQSRTSAMLLPWVGLPWIILAISKGLAKPGWRYSAIIALIVGSIGGINATSLIMIVAAPVLFILDFQLRNRHQLKNVVVFTVRTSVLCVLISAWWAVMVAIQGRYGGDVLTFSETVEAVSSTSTSTEVFRGLGYWLNYVVTPTFNGTTNALSYLRFGPLFIVSFIVPLAGLAGVLFVASPLRRVASWWIFVGVVLAVGVHPLDDSSPIMNLLASRPTSSLSLALRSSTRAIPVLILGLSVGLAALTEAVHRAIRSRVRVANTARAGRIATVVLIAVVVSVVPSRFTRGVSDGSLAHSGVPSYWQQAGSSLSATLGVQSRAMQLPGQEFGAHAWGYTVDPVLPAVTSTPVVTRDLLPLGDPQAMDVVNAIDDAARLGTLSKESIQSLSEMIGVGAIVVPYDLDDKRFGTYSAIKVQQMLRGFDQEMIGSLPNAISIHRVPGTSTASMEDEMTIVEGSGDGLVNIARNGLSTRFVRFSNDLTDDELADSISSGAMLVVTDSNRRQAQQWRGSLDTRGFTEDGSENITLSDSADRRLQIFPNGTPSTQTLVVQSGKALASATSYGYPLGYWPEARAAYAVDGRTDTAWTTSAFSNPIGQTITLKCAPDCTQLRLQQPSGRRWIASVEVRSDSKDDWTRIELARSSAITGQVVQLRRPSAIVDVRIVRVEIVEGFRGSVLDGVGFSEMLPRGDTVEKTIVPPRAATFASQGSQPIYVFSRVRAPENHWWRSDPEISFNRIFNAPSDGLYTLRVRGKVSGLNDEVFARMFGLHTYVSNAQSSDGGHRGWHLTDGDESTWWEQRAGEDSLPIVHVESPDGSDFLRFKQCSSDDCNAATRVKISDARHAIVAELSNATTVDTSALAPGRWTIQILDTTDRAYREPRFGLLIPQPLRIYEISGAGIAEQFQTDRVQRGPKIVLNGKAVPIVANEIEIDARGNFLLEVSVNVVKGLNELGTNDAVWLIDDVLLSPRDFRPVPQRFERLSIEGSATNRRIVIPPHDEPMWLVFREGFSTGWKATLNGTVLGGHARVNSGMNGWLLPPSSQRETVVLEFTPQKWAFAAQFLSLMAALCCVVVILRTRRDRVGPSEDWPQIRTSCNPLAKWAAVGATTAATALLISVSWLPVAFIVSSLAISPRRLRIIGLSAFLVVMFAITRMQLRILARDPIPDFDWTSSVEDFHRLLIFGLLALAAAVSLTDSRISEN